MSYQVFARKYRPRTFDELLGQDHVVRTLRNAIEQDRIAQAYLFSGPRGTGKTTTARLISKALNCPDGPRIDFDPDDPICLEIAEGRSLDVLEIDGASNNGVENVRDLNESVLFAPTSGQFRIVYIDEVHMLSKGAFNALLKTLEEPPPHVKFIFATTEPHKVLPTIISRCQRFDLRPMEVPVIARHLQHVCNEEDVKLEEKAALAVAKGADGGMRDALSMLDQLVAFCGTDIKEDDVMKIFGFTSRETIAELCKVIFRQDSAEALRIIQNETVAGKELGQIVSELITALRELLVAKIDPTSSSEALAQEAREQLLDQTAKLPAERVLNVIDILAETDGQIRNANNKRLHVEIGILKAIHTLGEASISDVIKVLGGASDQLAHIEAPPRDTSPKIQPAPAETLPPEPETPTTTTEPVETPTKAEITTEPEPLADPKASTEAEPAPIEREMSEALWNEVEAQIEAERPMATEFLAGSKFLGTDGAKVIIGIPQTESFARESLLRPNYRDFIETLIRKKTGGLQQLSIELREDLIAPIIEAPEPEAPAATPTPPPQPKAEKSEKKEETPENNEDDFYQDPLIKEALKIFEAELKSN